ncbi:rho guanine nucleotide exchange factor 5-like isoform X2 [Petaurus breviceps papuanus]|uniref:rho guanine nucleotide exchange factor 5-like isoform X2 n=1 Tax=Petaurus breviceps papuanus TaxID=3040969 RepID=UPI0036DA6847
MSLIKDTGTQIYNDKESALMEAEGPPRTASTPTTALEDLHIFPTSFMKNSCIPASEPEAAEREDPAWEWDDDDDDVFGAQQRDLSNPSTTEGTPPTLFQEDSLGSLEPDRGDVVTAESGVQRPLGLASQGLQEGHVPFIPTESSVSPTLVASLDIGPIPSETSSKIGVESWTEFANPLKETERSEASETVEKGIFLPSSTETKPCSPEEPNSPITHAGRRAAQQEGVPQVQEKKENGEQEGLLHQRQEEARDPGEQGKWEQRELEDEGELEWIGGLSGKQELEVVTYAQGQMGEQGQEDKGQAELVLGKQREGETFNREVKDQNHREGYPQDKDVEMEGYRKVGEENNQGNGLAEEQGKADHYDKDQELDGKQGRMVDEGKEKQGAVEEQWKLEGGVEEQGNVTRETLEVEGIVRRNENEEIQKHCGSLPLAQIVPGTIVSWESFPEDPISTVTRFKTQEGIKTESSRLQVSMYSSCPDSTLRPGQGSSESLQSIPPHSLSGKNSEKEAEQNGWEEGDRAMPILGKKPTPPRPIAIVPRTETSTPFTSTKADPNITTSSSSCPTTFLPIGDSSLPSHLPEFSRSFSTDKEFSFHHWDPDAALNILHIPSPGEAPLVPHANSDCTSTLNLPETSEETLQYHGSSSAPSSYGGGQLQYLAQPPASLCRSDLSQRLSEPAIHHVETPEREEQARLEPSSDPSSLSQLQGFTPYLERPGANHNQTSCPPKKEASVSGGLIHGSPPSSSMVEMGLHELRPPLPLRERHSHPPLVARHSSHLAKPPATKRYSHPPTLTLASGLSGSPERPSLPIKARHNRPLPSTPVTDTSHHTQTSRLRYNKPLPPTPVTPPPYHPPTSTTLSKKNKPLPPLPISDPDTKPPPLPPKAKWRSNSAHRTIVDVGDQLRSKPSSSRVPGGDWEVLSSLSAGRTSWPPAVDRPTDTLAFPGRNKSEMSPLAFSNMTNFLLLSPSSPAPSMTQDPRHSVLGGVQDDRGQSEGTLRTVSRGALQGDGNGPRRSDRGLARPTGKPSHPPLEKSSSWPHRKDPGKFLEMSGEHSESPAEEQNKTKGWSRQGLRRPSLFPGEALGE